ncbi:hypothetical protein EV182_002948 [Spiromyces aspiralis]|uniref:Uncharacterized protein n=1 Tax=Spiromyces aspiralis TaxID=68401 RepID=A0ACC1HRY1_9FUNG|nr:hypothetical protein EV182_002948 [Spiromyces aspiralis]
MTSETRTPNDVNPEESSPFVDENHFARAFFPDRWYAIALPVFLLIVGVTGIGGFLALVMIRSAGQKQGKKSS